MIAYEVFVRSFRDGNGDGIGDLKGIEEALWYFEHIGANLLWLTPIFPSPSYHGYDPTSYTNINPLYGTKEDLKSLVEKSSTKKIKILLDLPMNHTSHLHPWFKERPAILHMGR